MLYNISKVFVPTLTGVPTVNDAEGFDKSSETWNSDAFLRLVKHDSKLIFCKGLLQ